MNKGGYKGINIGLASIVVMFVVIALTIFAVLSVSTAAQEKELAQKYAASVSAYWAADCECADIANSFGALWEASADEAEIEKLAAELGAGVEYYNGGLIVSYERKISETSVLEVSIRLGEKFEIEKWRMISSDEDWTPDDTIPVWQG